MEKNLEMQIYSEIFTAYEDQRFNLGFEEKELIKLMNMLKSKDKSITGFNVGINCGEDAGQSIFHVHVHLIPRRKGDMKNPKGGVRGVIPEKQKY